MAALRNSNYYELGLVHPNAGSTGHTHLLYRDGYSDALDAIDADGCVPVPRAPGLGAALDWDYIRAHETGKVVYE
jgi:L-alanine-DL-glutamate epimerase-like enolase superfamily enzyme